MDTTTAHVVIGMIFGLGLPLYIRLFSFAVVWGYLGYLHVALRNGTREENFERTDTPIHRFFGYLVFQVGGSNWGKWWRNEYMRNYVFSRSIIGAIIGGLISLVLI